MNIDDIDRRLQVGINAVLLLLVFFLPLVLSTRSSEVFELPKMLFVYAMTAIIVGLWLGRMLVRREILIRQTPLDIPILLFLISQMASTIYSIDPAVSWWGWYGRFHGGLWSTISYTLLYYAFVTNFVDSNKDSPWRTPRRVLNVIIASATIVSIYAVLQHFGVDKNFWVQDVVNRVFSTQGQPNWLGAYLVVVLPLAWMLTITDLKIFRGKRKLIAILLYCYIAILFLALLFTKSRSGLVGLAVADAVFWFVILFNYFNPSSRVRSKATNREIQRSDSARDDVIRFLAIHLLFLILILTTNNPAREWVLNRQQATGGAAMESGITLRKSEHGGTESGDIRRIVWNGAIQLVKQRPIFGFGPETFGETYWRVRPKEHNLTSEWNFLYNKAHNEWLNLAANTGIFGLGSHLLLLTWFFIWAMRSFANFSRDEKFAKLNYLAAILAGLIGVEAVNFFGFSTVTIGIYRYLFMAATVSAAGNTNKLLKTPTDRQGGSVINIVSKLLKPIADRAVTSVIQDRDRDENLRKNMDLRQKFILAGLSVLILYLISQVSIFFLADLAYNRGRAYQDGGYIEEAVAPLIRAVNLVPGEPVFRAELAEAEGALAATLSQQDPSTPPTDVGVAQDDFEPLKEAALVNFEIVRKQSLYNLGFVRTEAKMLFLLGNCTDSAVAGSLDSSRRESGLARDDDNLCEEAIQLMKAAMEMAPTNPQLPYSLGAMLSKMGQTEEAAIYYNKAVELKPNYEEILPALTGIKKKHPD